MTIGFPHSSQSMSVGIGPTRPFVGADGFAPTILATIACALADSSLRSGMSASTCALSAPSSLEKFFMPRHLGKRLQPSQGPRLPPRRTRIPSPHFSQWIVVGIGLGLGGSGLPSLSRLMMVAQLGSPFSFFTE